MRRRREDGLVDHVLPAARELLLRGDARFDHLRAAATAHHRHGVADSERGRAADLHAAAVQRQRRLHEREAAVEVIADDEPRHDGGARADPQLLSLVHDVADRRDEPILADPDAVADALGSEQPGAHRVFGHGAVIDTIASMPGTFRFACTLMYRYVNGARFASRGASTVFERKRARLGKEVVDEPIDRRYAHQPARFLGTCADVRSRDEVRQVQ